MMETAKSKERVSEFDFVSLYIVKSRFLCALLLYLLIPSEKTLLRWAVLS